MMPSTRRYLIPVLIALVLIFAGTTLILWNSRSSPAPRTVVLQLPTRPPAPTPTPLPTRPPELASLQDAAANHALEQLRQVAEGADPYQLPGYLSTSLTIAACPYGCNRTPRLVGFDPDAKPVWQPATGPLIATGDPLNITLRASLSGTKAVDRGDGTPVPEPLTGHITVKVSREFGPNWIPVTFSVDPPLIPERRPGTPAPTARPAPSARPTDPVTGLEMSVGKPDREALDEHERLANEVLLSISTLAAGSPIPFEFAPEVQGQLQGIVSRYAPTGQNVTGLSLAPVEWERVEVRDPETLDIVDPETTASMVGYLSGSVWLTDANGIRSPKPLNPRAEHLVVNLGKRNGLWVVTNVSDGKLDQDRPGHGARGTMPPSGRDE